MALLKMTELTPLDLSLCVLNTVHDCEEKQDEDEVNYSEVFVKGLEEFVKNMEIRNSSMS